MHHYSSCFFKVRLDSYKAQFALTGLLEWQMRHSWLHNDVRLNYSSNHSIATEIFDGCDDLEIPSYTFMFIYVIYF